MKTFHAATAAIAVLASQLASAAEPVFSPDRVKADVTFLADDLLEGRGTGTRGHEIAAKYVAAQFAQAGLVPGAKDGSWFQRITLQQRQLTGETASVTITGPAGAQTWKHATSVIVATSDSEAATDVSAPLVFVGYGIDAPKQGFDDYRNLDVRGKIVVVLAGIPRGDPSETLAHLQTQKAVMAAAHGAIGTISISTLDGRKRRPWNRSVASADVPRMTWVAADGKAHVNAPEIKAGASLDVVAAEAAFAGAPTSLAKVLAQADKPGGHPKGFALKTSARIQAHTKFETLTTPEVIGMIPGSDPTLKNEAVVLMAHLDHLGMKADGDGDRIYNGALDNAAGVAVMLEVARGFAGDAVKPKRSLLFVANTAEEKGLLGAESFANDPSVPIGNIVSVVDLDQPMLLYDFTDVVAFGADHSTLGQSVAKAAGEAGIKLAGDPMPEETIFVRSDHYTFVKRGVPAILLATGYANGGEAAWTKFMSTNYHQVSDDLSQPINWASGAKYARVNYLITRDVADAPERPRWYKNDFFGQAFAPNAPKVDRPAK
ncbi:M28 family metallopeptidase [Glacieibacterium sp.]|uniref:M28 family metallopeptidase n=1 Tax=Glacieibacterium sp. TaxID=2860237 RepID=UPI003B002C33